MCFFFLTSKNTRFLGPFRKLQGQNNPNQINNMMQMQGQTNLNQVNNMMQMQGQNNQNLMGMQPQISAQMVLLQFKCEIFPFSFHGEVFDVAIRCQIIAVLKSTFSSSRK